MPVRQTELDGTDRGKPGLAYLDTDTYTRTINGVRTKGINKWVWNKAKKPSALQRKKLIALSLMSAVKTVLENHVYTFNGELYRQKKGGPIGENLTNLAASLCMGDMIAKYKKILMNLKIGQTVKFIKIYVDDLNQCGRCLPYGSTFLRGRLYRPSIGWTGRSWNGQAVTKEERKEIEDRGNTLFSSDYTLKDREAASAAVFREITNSIMPKSIKMKEDIPDNHPSGFLPILDTEMKVVNGQVVFRHYMKPMSSLEVVHSRSAMSQES